MDLNEGLSPEQMSLGHTWRRTFEEHFHQVLEWELFFLPGRSGMDAGTCVHKCPRILVRPVFLLMRQQFGKQLYARGIARHTPEVIAQKGRADLDALASFLGERLFLLADRPTSADTAVFGLVAPMVYWPMETPVAAYARSLPNIRAYCDRMRERLA